MTESVRATVPAATLESLIARCLEGVGVPADDAQTVAEALVYADLRGLDTHGLHRVPAYMHRVRLGLAGGTRELSEVAGSGAVRRLDAGHALGPAAAVRAVDLAADLAEQYGIGLVAVRRSTHFGAAGFYARRAARRGMVGIVTSNGPKGVAPHGAIDAFTGTNPLAIGIPLGSYGEFVLDMSTSAIPRERIRQAAETGEPLPEGVAIAADGRPTTDAAVALEGSVLPVGGAKGSGLGLAIALLAVTLGDADLDSEIGSMIADLDRPQNVGQLFVAINQAHLGDTEASARRAEALVDALHALTPAPGFERVAFSGETGDATAHRRATEGIPITPATLERVAGACDEADLPALADAARRLADAQPPVADFERRS